MPVRYQVTEGDTRPRIQVTMTEDDGTVIDMTDAAKTAKLYYREGGKSDTLWVFTMVKLAPTIDGIVEFVPDGTHEWMPASVVSRNPIVCEGEVRFEDTAATPARDQRMGQRLTFDVKSKFSEP